MFDDDLTKTTDAFVTFADYDTVPLRQSSDEGCPGYPHDIWLARLYLVDRRVHEERRPRAGVTVTASSSMGTAQRAEKARDGYPVGAPMDDAHEWVTNGGIAGSWIQYTFAVAQHPRAACEREEPCAPRGPLTTLSILAYREPPRSVRPCDDTPKGGTRMTRALGELTAVELKSLDTVLVTRRTTRDGMACWALGVYAPSLDEPVAKVEVRIALGGGLAAVEDEVARVLRNVGLGVTGWRVRGDSVLRAACRSAEAA